MKTSSVDSFTLAPRTENTLPAFTELTILGGWISLIETANEYVKVPASGTRSVAGLGALIAPEVTAAKSNAAVGVPIWRLSTVTATVPFAHVAGMRIGPASRFGIVHTCPM